MGSRHRGGGVGGHGRTGDARRDCVGPGGSARPFYVPGVRADDDPAATAAGLDDLLAAHRWTHGLDFVRRGTPTNNTDTAVSGLSLSSPDLVALLDNVLEGSSGGAGDAAKQVEPGPMTPGPSRPEPVPVPAVPRGSATSATRWRPRSASARTRWCDRWRCTVTPSFGSPSAMNAALWPATWGYLLRRLLGTAITAPDAEWIRDRFISYVPGGGALPSLRLGRQHRTACCRSARTTGPGRSRARRPSECWRYCSRCCRPGKRR